MPSKVKRRILIIEDSPDTQSLLAEFLRGQGYIVDCASNGFEAFELLRAPNNPLPRLILLDLMMPGMDGKKFRKEQQNDPNLIHIPVVVMTANGDCEAKSIEIGASGFLKKPFLGLQVILNTIDTFFPE